MPANNHGTRFKSEISGIKREPGVFIKSEFEPSLASLPMAPNMVDKKEPMEDSKTVRRDLFTSPANSVCLCSSAS